MNALTAVCKVLNVDPDAVEANLAFVSEKKIKELNQKFRGVDKVTDVLSFPNGDINPETGRRFLGDVLICRAVAKKQAELYGQSVEREINFLQIHGLLHLFGFDHETEEDDAKMRELQRKALCLQKEFVN